MLVFFLLSAMNFISRFYCCCSELLFGIFTWLFIMILLLPPHHIQTFSIVHAAVLFHLCLSHIPYSLGLLGTVRRTILMRKFVSLTNVEIKFVNLLRMFSFLFMCAIFSISVSHVERLLFNQ